MSSKFIIILLTIALNICSETPNSNLKGDDYRLFKNTPAWELAKSVQSENEKKINEIVSKSPNLINFQEPKYGETLLMLTIMNQQIKSFEILLQNKANVNIHDTYTGRSALIIACDSKFNDIRFAQMLIKYGANVNDVETGKRKEWNTTRFTPLIAAARAGNLELVKLLIKNGADVNYQNEYEQSALSESIMADEYKVALYLLQKGADYTKPIFYRPDFSIPMEKRDTNDKGKPIYLVNLLREASFDLNSNQYKDKMKIVNFLKKRGIDYQTIPIPKYIKEQAQKKYPKTWKNYLEKY